MVVWRRAFEGGSQTSNYWFKGSNYLTYIIQSMRQKTGNESTLMNLTVYPRNCLRNDFGPIRTNTGVYLSPIPQYICSSLIGFSFLFFSFLTFPKNIWKVQYTKHEDCLREPISESNDRSLSFDYDVLSPPRAFPCCKQMSLFSRRIALAQVFRNLSSRLL